MLPLNSHNARDFMSVNLFLWTVLSCLAFFREIGAVEKDGILTEAETSRGHGTFPIVMPRVRPELPRGESYLCTAVKVSEATDPLYVTRIEPRASMDTAHHLLVVGCSNPVHGGHSSGRNLWNCGGTLGEEGLAYSNPCRKSKQVRFNWIDCNVLYMDNIWTRNNLPGTELPLSRFNLMTS